MRLLTTVVFLSCTLSFTARATTFELVESRLSSPVDGALGLPSDSGLHLDAMSPQSGPLLALIAAVASTFVPGLGQFIAGTPLAGVLFLGGTIASYAAGIFFLTAASLGGAGTGGVGIAFFVLALALHVGSIAHALMVGMEHGGGDGVVMEAMPGAFAVAFRAEVSRSPAMP